MSEIFDPALALAGGDPLGVRLQQAAADRVRAAFLAHLVAAVTGVSAWEIVGTGRRDSQVSNARQMAMYLAHVAYAWPLARVGFAFGRNRSTVGHACQRVEAMRDDPQVDVRLTELEACLRAAPLAAETAA